MFDKDGMVLGPWLRIRCMAMYNYTYIYIHIHRHTDIYIYNVYTTYYAHLYQKYHLQVMWIGLHRF